MSRFELRNYGALASSPPHPRADVLAVVKRSSDLWNDGRPSSFVAAAAAGALLAQAHYAAARSVIASARRDGWRSVLTRAMLVDFGLLGAAFRWYSGVLVSGVLTWTSLVTRDVGDEGVGGVWYVGFGSELMSGDLDGDVA